MHSLGLNIRNYKLKIKNINMSQPITNCIQMKAIVDEETNKILFEIHKSNHIDGGHFSVFGCNCTPSCQEKYKITEDMLNKYNERMKKEWDIFMNEHDKDKCIVCSREKNRA